MNLPNVPGNSGPNPGAPALILINPWIYDFAAYDLWSKPLGLLYLAGYLRACGFQVHLIDCLDVHAPPAAGDPPESPPLRRSYGTGKFRRQIVPPPPPLARIRRRYSRYGIPPQAMAAALRGVSSPAAVLVTSLMTYWYPGVQEAIRLAREIHPGVPVILGGIYARLCPEHARACSGADQVSDATDPAGLLAVLAGHGIRPPANPPGRLPYPAFDLLGRLEYVCLLTSRGCPCRCRYCASLFLDPEPVRRDPAEVLAEIRHWHCGFGVRDFAFYDDALLVAAETHLAVLLEGLARRDLPLRFHTPNALHVREITPEIARLMARTGFRTLRLGLETSDSALRRELDAKTTAGEFLSAMDHLARAGFPRRRIGAYVLAGLPGQSAESVLATLEFVGRSGAVPLLAEYSPIPRTPLWEQALRQSRYDLAAEPLYHNNTLLPCWDDARRAEFPRLRQRALEIRNAQCGMRK